MKFSTPTNGLKEFIIIVSVATFGVYSFIIVVKEHENQQIEHTKQCEETTECSDKWIDCKISECSDRDSVCVAKQTFRVNKTCFK